MVLLQFWGVVVWCGVDRVSESVCVGGCVSVGVSCDGVVRRGTAAGFLFLGFGEGW